MGRNLHGGAGFQTTLRPLSKKPAVSPLDAARGAFVTMRPMKTNYAQQGDNLELLKAIPEPTVDLVYLHIFIGVAATFAIFTISMIVANYLADSKQRRRLQIR